MAISYPSRSQLARTNNTCCNYRRASGQSAAIVGANTKLSFDIGDTTDGGCYDELAGTTRGSESHLLKAAKLTLDWIGLISLNIIRF